MILPDMDIQLVEEKIRKAPDDLTHCYGQIAEGLVGWMKYSINECDADLWNQFKRLLNEVGRTKERFERHEKSKTAKEGVIP